ILSWKGWIIQAILLMNSYTLPLVIRYRLLILSSMQDRMHLLISRHFIRNHKPSHMVPTMTPFNRPYLTKALDHIADAIAKEHVSGNGGYTKKCHSYFNNLYSTPTLLTTSCTSALDMSVLLADIGPGDEVIMPSFTFVSTANPFLLRGAK